MADLKQTPAELQRETQDALARKVEDATRELHGIAEHAIAEMRSAAMAAHTLPSNASGLVATAKLAMVQDVVLSSAVLRNHRVGIELGQYSFRFRDPAYPDGPADLPAGRYRVLLFVLPLEGKAS